MSILIECPICHKKHATKNKRCKCGENLDKAKRNERVKYWIAYRIGKKQRREYAGMSMEDARDAEGKRRAQKREGRIFEMLPDSRITFSELTKWYSERESTKALASCSIIEMKLNKFNRHFGDRQVYSVTSADLKDFQAKLKKEGLAPATVDQDLGKVKAMIYAAFENGKVGADVFRAFKSIKKTLVKGSDVRTRIISADEYKALMAAAPDHLKGVLAMGYHTGMRRGEILGLTWDRVDLQQRMIFLEAADTKDKEPRRIPLNAELIEILKAVPSRLAKADEDRHVFQFNGKPFLDMRDALRKACKTAKIKYGRFERDGFIFHDLRHTFTTNARRAGVPEREIMAITGHTSRSTFDRYSTVDDNDLRKAIERIEVFSANVDQSVDQNQKENPAGAGLSSATD
jgi:integrase